MKAEWQEDKNGATVGLASLDSRPLGLDGLRHQQKLAAGGGNCSCLLHAFRCKFKLGSMSKGDFSEWPLQDGQGLVSRKRGDDANSHLQRY